MNRREFLRTAGGTAAVAAGTAAAGGTAAAQSSPTVKLTGDLKFKPAELYVKPGTKVTFDWVSDGHNIVVESQPDGANWKGSKGGASKLYDTGHTHEHTFKTKGTYDYYCAPHRSAGMVGKIIVNKSGKAPGAGSGGEADPKHMGVPIQAHFVGLATILAICVSLVFTFFTLKYGESPHASGGNR